MKNCYQHGDQPYRAVLAFDTDTKRMRTVVFAKSIDDARAKLLKRVSGFAPNAVIIELEEQFKRREVSDENN